MGGRIGGTGGLARDDIADQALVAGNLKPELAAKVKEAFFSFPWKGTELEKEFAQQGVSKFVPITYQKEWEIVRKVDAAMNVGYACK